MPFHWDNDGVFINYFINNSIIHLILNEKKRIYKHIEQPTLMSVNKNLMNEHLILNSKILILKVNVKSGKLVVTHTTTFNLQHLLHC